MKGNRTKDGQHTRDVLKRRVAQESHEVVEKAMLQHLRNTKQHVACQQCHHSSSLSSSIVSYCVLR